MKKSLRSIVQVILTWKRGIMKIFKENFLMYSLRQRKSQTNIVQSSFSANENLNKFCADSYQKMAHII